MFIFEFDHFDWRSEFYREWRHTSKLVNFQNLYQGVGIWFKAKFDNDQNFLILFHSSRKHEEIKFTFEFDDFDWLSQFHSEWRQTSKLVNFKISPQVLLCDLGQNLIMTKTS